MADGQLALAFPHSPHRTEAELLPREGARLALEYLGRTESWPGGRLALWGGSGSGKTHLLHVWARERGAAIVPGAELREPIWPESPVAVDDADRVPSEPALLHLLNAAGEAGHPVLLTASRPPGRIASRLPDLVSRLRAVTAVEIGPADDRFLATLLQRLLAERQLPVAADVQSWMLTRLPRTGAAVEEAVDRLDRAQLAARGAVTRALAARALHGLFRDEPTVEASQ